MLHPAGLPGKTRCDNFSGLHGGVDAGAVKGRPHDVNAEPLQCMIERRRSGLVRRREDRQGVYPARNPAALGITPNTQYVTDRRNRGLGEFFVVPRRERISDRAKENPQQRLIGRRATGELVITMLSARRPTLPSSSGNSKPLPAG